MEIRVSRELDLERLAWLFTESVHGLAAGHYDAEQRAAWAPQPPSLAAWRDRLEGVRTLLAEEQGELAGFISYEPSGQIDLLFTSPAHARRGVASLLYRRADADLNSLGVRKRSTKASSLARPFFERHGFEVVHPETVCVRGIWFLRYAMESRGSEA